MLSRRFNSTFLLILLATGLNASCANNDYFEPTPLASSENALVYVYRPAGTNPGKKPLTTSYPEILINGKGSGFLRYKEYLAIELPAGQYEFVATGLTRDARWKPQDVNYTISLKSGESYFMRLRVEFNTDHMTIGSFRDNYLIHLHPVDESEAVYEIRHTSLAKKP